MLPARSRALVVVGLLGLVAFLAPAGAALVAPVPVPQPLPALGYPVSARACEDLCPDMTVDANSMNPYLSTINYGATDCAVREGMTPPGPQRILRFTTTLPNNGPGDLVIGSPAQDPENFVYSACHGHYHTKDYAAHRVWTAEGYQAYSQLRLANPFYPADLLLEQLPAELKPVAGSKQGFCVFDLAPASGGGPLNRVLSILNERRFQGCGYMGISAGWSDIYSSGITGQWVVITGVPAGEYVFEIEVNPNHHYQELNYWNNSVTRAVTIT